MIFFEILILILLIYAAWKDIQERKVSNKVTLLILIFSMPLISENILNHDLSWYHAVIVLWLISGYLLKGYGAADLKALIPISLSFSLRQDIFFFFAFLISSIVLKFAYRKEKGAPLFVAILISYASTILMIGFV